MFTKNIGNMRLTDRVGDKLFPRINQINSYMDEKSFLATARAMLGRRVPEDESVTIEYGQSDLSKRIIEGNGVDAVFNAILSEGSMIRKVDHIGVLRVQAINCDSEENNKFHMEFIKKNLENYIPGFREVPDLGAFVGQKKMDVTFLINEERKSFIILVCGLDIKKWHFLQALITRYFPWYFKDSPLTPDEVAVVKSLANRYAPEYERAIEAIASTYDFREATIRDGLEGFESVFQRERLENVRREIRRTEEIIQNLEAQFSSNYMALDQYTTEELGLVEKINSGKYDNEIMEYFLANKTLNLVRVSDGSVEFVTATTIDSFDPEVFDRIISNRGSYFYRVSGRKYNSEIKDDQIEMLMRAMFDEGIMKLRTVTAFTLNFKTGDYAAHRGYSFGSEFADYLPNMHIQRHSCLGSNSQYIRDSMIKRDYIGAFEACLASAKNMNMGDGIVVEEFMKGILSESAAKIIQMPDGSIATPKEAIAWLEARNA